MIENRLPGEFTTLETRTDSNDSIDKNKRYQQILECLREFGALTAKECAVMMMQKGYSMTAERNVAAPRLTEMSQNGMVEPVGKKVCAYTGKKVAVYQIRDGR